MASSFDYNRGKWTRSDDPARPVQDKYEKMYYPVIKLLSTSTEAQYKRSPNSSLLRPAQLQEETVPLHPSLTTESMTFADAETVLVENPARARLIKNYAPRKEPKPRAKTCCEVCSEPVTWNRWKIWVMGLLLLFILVTFAIVLTWTTTRAVIERRTLADAEVVVFGSLTFLLRNSTKKHALGKRSVSPSAFETINQKVGRRNATTNRKLCRAGTLECKNQYIKDMKQEYKHECSLEDYQSANWNLQRQMETFILHNSSLCTWHRCKSFEICCWKSPSEGDTVLIGYSLVLSPRGTCANHVESGRLSDLGTKIATMLSGSSRIYSLVQKIIYPNKYARPSVFRSVRSCVHTIEFDRSYSCRHPNFCNVQEISASQAY